MSLVVEHNGQTFYLGRVPSTYDRRNEDYIIENLYEITRPPKTTTWEAGVVLDQAQTPSCTGHAGRGWELCKPIQDPNFPADGSVPDNGAIAIWEAAQMEEFGHTDPNDGATIHGVAKALHDPNGTLAVDGKARMKNYVWARTLGGVLNYLSYRGPLIIGISWYNSMFNPGADGVLTVDPRSGLAGGHALLVYGLDMERQLVRIRNSWGSGWGVQGDCFMHFNDADQLFFKDFGEVCSGAEQVV